MNFGSVGFSLTGLLVFLVVAVALVLWPACRICRKAGYPAFLGVLFFLPLLNIAIWLYLAFAEWPLERRARGTGPT